MILKGKIEKYKKVLKNSGWMFLMQAANYIFPLITVPYLVKTLGPEKYGVIAIAQALMQYIIVISDYGFSVTATRDVAIFHNDSKLIKELYNDVFICKLCIMLLCFIIMCIIGFFWPLAVKDKILYVVAFLIVVGNVLFPLWFFQAIQEMKYITYINLVSRLISVILTFVLIKQSSDYILAIAIPGICGMISGILALILIYFKFELRIYRWPNEQKIKLLLRDGKEIFISNAFGHVYAQGGTIITGLIAGNIAAGYFSLGQKVSGILVNIAQPISQAIYPYLCQIFSQSKEEFLKLKGKIMGFGIILSGIIAIGQFCASEYITYILLGRIEPEVLGIMKIFSLVTMGNIINTLLYPILSTMKKYVAIQKTFVSIATLFILISVPVAYFYGSYGMAIVMVLIECYIFINFFKVLTS